LIGSEEELHRGERKQINSKRELSYCNLTIFCFSAEHNCIEILFVVESCQRNKTTKQMNNCCKSCKLMKMVKKEMVAMQNRDIRKDLMMKHQIIAMMQINHGNVFLNKWIAQEIRNMCVFIDFLM